MNEIARAQQRTRGYWYSDGIVEMVEGLGLVVLGAILYGVAKTDIAWLGIPLPPALVLLAQARLPVVRLLKNAITHQRTGYVKYPSATLSRRRRIQAFYVLAAVAVLAAIVLRWVGFHTLEDSQYRAIFLGYVGFLVVGGYLFRTWRTRVLRFLIHAMMALGIVVAIALKESGSVERTFLLLSAIGLTSALIGAATLYSYLRRHPRELGEAL